MYLTSLHPDHVAVVTGQVGDCDEAVLHEVVEVGKCAFANSTITKITIPASVEILCPYAFQGSDRLIDVCFQENSKLCVIEHHCFENCPKLVRFDCPSSVRKLGKRCFYGCRKLSRFGIRDDSLLMKIEERAFYGCEIREFCIPKYFQFERLGGSQRSPFSGILSVKRNLCKHVILENDMLMSMDRKVLISCFSSDAQIMLPGDVTQIIGDCFYACARSELVVGVHSSLKDILARSIPATMKVICRSGLLHVKGGDLCGFNDAVIQHGVISDTGIVTLNKPSTISEYCFHGCQSIKELVVLQASMFCCSSFAKSSVQKIIFRSGNLRSLMKRAFYRCESLKEVVFEEGCRVNSLGTEAFAFTGITNITIRSNVSKIEKRCFFGCKSLKSVVFEENSELYTLGSEAFAETAIDSIIIPHTLNELESDTLCGIPNVTMTGKTGKYIIYKRDWLLELDYYKVITYLGRNEDVLVPRAILSIGSHSFYKNKYAKRVRFEEGSVCTTISDNAFDGCFIESLVIPPSVQYVGRILPGTVEKISCEVGNPNVEVCGRDQFISTVDSTQIVQYFGDEKCVTVPDYIRSLGISSFSNSSDVREVDFEECSELSAIDTGVFEESSLVCIKIPDSLTSIGSMCFQKCLSLHSVIITKDSCLENLATSCFAGSSIRSFVIPSNVVRIPNNCFCGCSLLSNISFVGNNVTTIGEMAFHGCISLTGIALPIGVEVIESQVFKGSGLTTIRIPSSVQVIEKECFKGCVRLHSAEFEEGTRIQTLSIEMFSGTGLETFSVPPSVTKIDDLCFAQCPYLSIINFIGESELVELGTGVFMHTVIEAIVLPKKVTAIGHSCFSSCPKLRSLSFDEDSSITSIRATQLFRGSTLNNLSLPSRLVEFNPSVVVGVESLTIQQTSKSFDIEDQFVFSEKNEIIGMLGRNESVDVPLRAASITSHCFSGNHFLRSLSFSSNSEIPCFPDSAFAECALREIFVPKSVKSIALKCFYKCTFLSNVHFESGSLLKEIGKNAFEGTTLREIMIPDSVRVLREECFSNCNSLVSIIFGDNSELETIECGAFQHAAITTFTVPKHVQEIEFGAFLDCHLNEFRFTEDCEIEMLDGQIFEYLEELYIPDSIEYIGGEVLRGISRVHVSPTNENFATNGSMLFGIDLTEIHGCFEGVVSVVVPKDVTSISAYAFSCVTTLKEVIFESGSSLHTIERKAFEGTAIQEIEIPSSVAKIGTNCFSCCYSLKRVVFADDCPLTRIDNWFSSDRIQELVVSANVREIDQEALTEVQSVTISENNPYLVSSGRFITNKSGKLVALIGSPVSLICPKSIHDLPAEFFCNHMISFIMFESGTTISAINPSVFRHAMIRSITIPKTVQVIHDHAFFDCTQLFRVVFEEGSELRRIECESFVNTLVSYLHLPVGIEYIGYNFINRLVSLFIPPENGHYSCSNSEMIIYDRVGSVMIRVYGARREETIFKVPNHVSTIAKDCFRSCPWIHSLQYENTHLKCIEESAFQDSSLVSIEIPRSVTAIGKVCFEGSSLERIAFRNTKIEVFQERLFANTKLQAIVIPSSVVSIQESCFAGADKLESVVFEKNSPLVSIGKWSFSGTALKEVHLPRNVKIVGEGAFANCTQLSSLEFEWETACRYIMSNAFMNNPCLLSVSLPSSIDTIQRGAFDDACKLGAPGALQNAIDAWRLTQNGDFLTRSPNFYMNGDYVEQRELGRGSYGRVSLIRNKFTGEEYAVKHFVCQNTRIEELIRREISFTQSLQHPCTVSLFGYQISAGKQSSMCTEYVKHGSLDTILSEKPDWFNDTAKAKIIAGIVIGMMYTHENRIIHRDLKPSNILIDENHCAKIGDFGSANIETGNMETRNVGTIIYSAPEVLNGDNYNSKIDVFSFGVTLYEILEEKRVFSAKNPADVFDQIRSDVRPAISNNITEEVRELIEECWAFDSIDRPTFNDIFSRLYSIDFQLTADTDSDEVMEYVFKVPIPDNC